MFIRVSIPPQLCVAGASKPMLKDESPKFERTISTLAIDEEDFDYILQPITLYLKVVGGYLKGDKFHWFLDNPFIGSGELFTERASEYNSLTLRFVYGKHTSDAFLDVDCRFPGSDTVMSLMFQCESEPMGEHLPGTMF